MRKILMSLAVVMIVVPVAFVLTGCFGPSKAFFGTWQIASYTHIADPIGYEFPKTLSEANDIRAGLGIDAFGYVITKDGYTGTGIWATSTNIVMGPITQTGYNFNPFGKGIDTPVSGMKMEIDGETLVVKYTFNGVHVYTMTYAKVA